MAQEERNKEPEKIQNKFDRWIDKAEEFIDDATEKIHKSEAYRKVDKSFEKATKNIFRQAEKWWGKSKR
jgi:DNA-binding transcriptional regulator GbsR (MarR family)